MQEHSDMYAVIKAGGHQYKVQEGDSLTIDKMVGEAGEKITFDKVLMIGGSKVVLGHPLVAGAFVEATIKEQTRNPKIIVFKYRRRKNSKVKQGHKQPVTVIEIKKIKA
jgi:large subunit ribosomal protein L21